MTLLPHVIWAGVAIFAVVRICGVAENALLQNSQDIAAARVDDQVIGVPEDLVAIATQEREVWAQEEVMRVIRERYEALRDWNAVRSAMGVGRRDDA